MYRITERGERVFLELLQESPAEGSAEDTRFRVRFAFFRYLPPETRIRLLERRRTFLEERLITIDESIRIHRGRDDDYALALMEHGRTATESDITWLEGLIRGEREKTNRDLERGGARSRRTAVLRRKEHTT